MKERKGTGDLQWINKQEKKKGKTRKYTRMIQSDVLSHRVFIIFVIN